MSKKAKPKSGWRDSGTFSFRPFTQGDLRKISDALDISEIHEKFVDNLNTAKLEYLTNKERIPQIPRSANVKAALTELQKRAEALIEAIEQLDIISLDKLSTADFPKNLDLFDLCENHPVLKGIYRICSVAEITLKNLKPDKGGRPRERTAQRGLIISLKIIYEAITKKKAGRTFYHDKNRFQGPFYHFVYTVLNIIDSKAIHSNAQLGQQILIALRRARFISKAELNSYFDRVPIPPVS